MRPRSPSPHYTHAPSQLTDQSSLCGFNAPSMVQRMSGLVQRLRDLCCWWSLELLRDEKAHQQGLRLLKQNLSPASAFSLKCSITSTWLVARLALSTAYILAIE